MIDFQQITNAITISYEEVKNSIHHELGMTKVSVQKATRLLKFVIMHPRMITSREYLILYEANSAGSLERLQILEE